MAYENIDLETAQPNGKTGEPATTAWAKTRRMLTELYKSWTNASYKVLFTDGDGKPVHTAVGGLFQQLVAVGDGAALRALAGLNKGSSANWFDKVAYISGDGVLEIGNYLDFHAAGNENQDYYRRMVGGDLGFYIQRIGQNVTRAMYDQGNILGAVGQVGGVPTGAIIETGTNANGRYIRWADGTQICIGTVGTQTQVSATAGTAGYHAYVGIGTFAAGFAGVPNLLFGVFQQASYYGMACADAGPSATQTGSVYIWSPSNGFKGQASYVAIGRWF
ncbi:MULTISPECIES: hypothetical protein [unclassified Pseudomonas]|uniref:hypothetical protein n=1 Tax=unclassified Pseudomonas TaxID=196821 RepID=UPI00131B7363|nr:MULTISPECIES: hypothetical protein [unclassified Pseudomonas]